MNQTSVGMSNTISTPRKAQSSAGDLKLTRTSPHRSHRNFAMSEKDLPVGLVQLDTISLLALDDRESSESSKLFRDCAEDGYFFLDLRGTLIVEDYNRPLSISKEYSEQSLEAKSLDDASSDAFG